MELIEKMTLKAKANPQRIVLPEGTEPRTLTAADRIIGEKLAEIVLIGDPRRNNPCYFWLRKSPKSTAIPPRIVAKVMLSPNVNVATITPNRGML